MEKIIQCKKDKKMKELKYSTKMKEIITERLHCLEELREHKCMQCNKLNLHMKQMNERAIYLYIYIYIYIYMCVGRRWKK